MADPATGTEISPLRTRPILFELRGPLAGGSSAGRRGGGEGPFHPAMKPVTFTTQDGLYPDAFRLPRLPKPLTMFEFKSRIGGWPIGPKVARTPDVIQKITGVTRDSTGVALGNCVVQLFRTVNDVLVVETTSDANGNFAITAGGDGFYIVAYKVGSPDVAGTTLNTLIGS